MHLLRSKDVLSGLLFIVAAGLFARESAQLDLGSVRNLGAGAFPLILSCLLGLVGLVVVVNGIRARMDFAIEIAWRAGGVVLLAVVAFAATVVPLGFAPAVALASFVSSLASARFRIFPALLQTCVVTAFCAAVFIKGLGLPFQLFGPWLGGY